METSPNPILCSRQGLQVLQNEDLLAHIFSYECPDYFSGNLLSVEDSRRKDLFSACLTCRSFTKPALDLLWRHMRSLMPLFKVLPTFVKDSRNEVYTFNGAIQPAHKARFEMYARKIRTLSIEKWPKLISSHCIHRLLSLSTLPFFPTLKTVIISAETHTHSNIEQFTPLFLVYGGLLARITIKRIKIQNQSLMTSFFLHLLDKTPNIQEITLSGDLCPEILALLKSFRKLQLLSLSFSSSFCNIFTLLQDLRDMPDLNELCLRFGNNLLDRPTSFNTGGTCMDFAALRVLTIGGTPINALKTLRFFFRVPTLRIVTFLLQGEGRDTPENPTHIPRSLAECCRIAPNMESFKLYANSRVNLGVNIPPEISSNILNPFIQCRQLSLLHISPFVRSAVNDDQIRYLTESRTWRSLETLQLHSPCNPGPSPSLTGILAQNCPNLVRLAIPIDFTKHTPSSLQAERRHPRTSHSTLRQLTILETNTAPHPDDLNQGHATQMAVAVARFLEHFFPNPQLELVVSGDNQYAHESQWWGFVRMSVAEYHAVRAETLAESSLLGTTT